MLSFYHYADVFVQNIGQLGKFLIETPFVVSRAVTDIITAFLTILGNPGFAAVIHNLREPLANGEVTFAYYLLGAGLISVVIIKVVRFFLSFIP